MSFKKPRLSVKSFCLQEINPKLSQLESLLSIECIWNSVFGREGAFCG